MASAEQVDLAARVARLEAFEQIRQLAARYGLAADSRDIDGLIDLFTDDDREHFQEGIRGREALRGYYNESQRRYSNSQHFMCNHVVDVLDEDHATGVVYAYVEQELGDKWTVLALQYWDTYERQGDRWLFAERRAKPWYFTEWDEKPTGPMKMRFPDRPHGEAPLPQAWPTWDKFWSSTKR
jgi:hypothetical protein